MTRIADLLARGPTFSFEFAPPRTPEAEDRLAKTLVELESLGPSFVSVTYGAGGSTRDTTKRIVDHIATATSMTVMPHLTCVAHLRSDLEAIVAGYRDCGIENLLALGGDPPEDGAEYPTDFTYATELIELAKGIGDFCIGVAAFPELHPRSPDRDTDRRWLAAKLRLADFGITQFFFDADHYFRMRDELDALGVDTPVLPGLFSFVNVEQARRFARINGAAIPAELDRRMDAVDGKPPEVRKLAVEVCTALGERLLDGGAPGLHIYTMNFSRGPTEIWHNLRLGERRA
jgi:methylenetetrahydrofolate reductase (NADPH)